MSSIKLKHSGGNGVSITAPDTNPSSDRTVKLPSTDVDGVIATKDSNNSLQSVSGLSGSAFSNRNLLINGAMLVWQRNSSTTTDGGYCADRFWAAGSGVTYARSTDTPAGFKYSAKLTHSSADLSIGQPIELCATGSSQPMVAGNTVTLSFYGKVDSGTEPIVARLKFRDSKFSSTNEVAFTSSDGEPTLTTSWQRFTRTFTIPTVGGTNIMAAFELGGISRTAYFTGFQLEEGPQVTPFEFTNKAEELQLCMRYFYRWSSSVAYSNFDIGYATSASNVEVVHQLPVIMRANPNLTTSGTFRLVGYGPQTYNNISSISLHRSHPRSPYLRCATSGLASGLVGEFGDAGSNNATMSFDAEL